LLLLLLFNTTRAHTLRTPKHESHCCCCSTQRAHAPDPQARDFAHNAFRTTLRFHINSKKSLALTLGVHLQGYVQFEKKAVLNSAKKILFGDKNHRVHLEFSKHY
jgi:hypothetical protein